METTENQEPKPAELVVLEKKAQTGAMLSKVKAFILDSPEAYEATGATLIMIKELEDGCEAAKQVDLKPLNNKRAALHNLWKPLETELEQARKIITDKMKAYNAAVRAKEEEDRAKLQARIDSGTIKKPETIMKHQEKIVEARPNVYVGSRSVKEKTVMKLSVIDETKIPREYFDLNRTRLERDLRDGKVVAGAELVEDKQFAVR